MFSKQLDLMIICLLGKQAEKHQTNVQIFYRKKYSSQRQTEKSESFHLNQIYYSALALSWKGFDPFHFLIPLPFEMLCAFKLFRIPRVSPFINIYNIPNQNKFSLASFM